MQIPSNFGVREVKSIEYKDRFSFTADIATYDTCARLYKLQRIYEFMPEKNMGMLYGELIHLTVERIHNEIVHNGKEHINKKAIREWLLENYEGLKKADIKGNVVVIGGGNVAIDTARSARRFTDGNITMVSLESAEEMPAKPEEIEDAKADNIKIENS